MAEPSARAKLHQELMEWLRNNPRWNAPYGILEGYAQGKNSGVARVITFGIARYLDASLSIYSPTYLILWSSRTGNHKFASVEALKEYLNLPQIP